MLGLLSQFGTELLVVAALAALTVAAAAAVAGHRASRGRAWGAAASRVLAVGAVGCVLVATAAPALGDGDGHRGDLAWQPGRGGLGDLAARLADPDSLATVLLVLNLVMFVPVGLFAALGWPGRAGRVLLACLGLSLLVETAQLLFGGRVAATDDVLLNLAGAAAGVGVARVATRLHRAPRRKTRSPINPQISS